MLKNGVGRNSLNVYLSFDGFLRRVCSLLRAGEILHLYNALAWRHRYFSLSKILSAFFTRSLGMRLASSHGDLIFKTLLHPELGIRLRLPRPLFQNSFSFFLFPLTEEGGYFRFGIIASHLASIFFSPCQAIC